LKGYFCIWKVWSEEEKHGSAESSPQHKRSVPLIEHHQHAPGLNCS